MGIQEHRTQSDDVGLDTGTWMWVHGVWDVGCGDMGCTDMGIWDVGCREMWSSGR